jgi:hypothetical protein
MPPSTVINDGVKPGQIRSEPDVVRELRWQDWLLEQEN